MADQFTTTSTTGYGNRIVNSLSGVVFGILLFLGSFVVLYLNEGRVDISKIAKTAVEISSTGASADSPLNGKLVSVTGIVSTNENIGDRDNIFFNPGNYIAVSRKVEMYSWVETKKTTNTNNNGGSSTTSTTYSYSKDWEENPADSSQFNYPDGHQNPKKNPDSVTNYATTANVGAYTFNPSSATLPSFTKVALNAQNTTLTQEASINSGSYVFISNNKTNATGNPEVGDVRISYYVLSPGFNGTIFGALNGNNIVSYVNQNNIALYRLFNGTRAQGIATLHSEYELWIWIFRAVGFVMMWIGLLLLFGPIITILDILPILGGVAGALIGIVIFPVALILTIVTILVSIIAHSIAALIVALVITIVVMVGILIFLREKKKKTNPVTLSDN